MKCVVFGGAGFLGSHVADELTSRGWDVVVYDLVPSPHLLPGQTMIVGDILDQDKVRMAVEGCTTIFNFAGIADLDDAQTKPLDTIRLNILGNSVIIDAALAAGCKRYLYSSSIYVYSHKGGFYRASKQASELYIEEYQRKYGLEFTILRYGTIYGPRSDVRNSVHRYIRMALTDGTISVGCSGEELREYIHVRDAARLTVDAVSQQFANTHLTISGNTTLRFIEMLKTIKEIISTEVKLDIQGNFNESHYSYTPYSFTPKPGMKLVSSHYVDFGQGLLECVSDIYCRLERKEQVHCMPCTPPRGTEDDHDR